MGLAEGLGIEDAEDVGEGLDGAVEGAFEEGFLGGDEAVLGEGGPLNLPPDVEILVGRDGTISALQPGASPAVAEQVGRLKLVNPPQAGMARGDDGLFRLRSGADAEADPAVTVESGALEGSNVNVVDAMVRMIDLGRQFDTQMSLLKHADGNASKADQVLNLM